MRSNLAARWSPLPVVALSFVLTVAPPAGGAPAGDAPGPWPSAGARVQPFGALPVDFTGVLPCRGCAGVRRHLRLLPGGVFHLATTELRQGEDVTAYDIGVWSVSSDGRILLLHGGREAPWRFTIRDPATLAAHDAAGREIASDLQRNEHAGPLEPRLHMLGLYRPAGDGGSFTVCLTGRRLRVAREADHAALEEAVRAKRGEPREAVRVSVEGRIATRPRTDGSGEDEVLVVEKFEGVRDGSGCGPGFVTSDLEGTRWRPTQLLGEPVIVSGRQREPYFVLDARRGRVAGSTGCNRMSGTYRRGDTEIRFAVQRTTRAACPAGSGIEAAFQRALAATRTWRVLGTLLELFDENGRMIARCEARDL